ncbi:MAG TPA: hypothetical protein VGD02_08945 [Gemmatimonadaceae bacterium]|jgi:hypothetical protein
MGIFRNDPQPYQQVNRLPVSALTTGDQPPRTSVAGAIAMVCVLASQLNAAPVQQQSPGTAAWNVPAAVAQVPFTRSQPASPAPDPAALRPVQVAVLTLIYGDQPVPSGPIPPAKFAGLVRSWDPPRSEPPALIKIVPLTFTYGDQPIGSRQASRNLEGRGAWDAPFQRQSSVGTAAWNVPLVVQFIPSTRAAAQVPALDPPVQPLARIAPLTLVYGQQPPATGPLSPTQREILGIVAPWWPSASASPNAAWNITIATVSQPTPRRPDPTLIRFAWEPAFVYPESEGASAGWNVPQAPFVPSARLQSHILQQSETIARQRRTFTPQPAAVQQFVPAARTGPIAVFFPRDRFDAAYIRRFIAPLIGIIETDALSAVIQVTPRFTGIVSVSAELAAVLDSIERMEGTIGIAPRLDGIVQVGPRFAGIILIRPES